MSMMVRKALILALALASGAFAAELSKRDADRARQTWMAGYLKLETAAKAAREQKFMFALELYEEALAVFQEVQVLYPGWSSDVVAYRIDYAKARVRELRDAAEMDAEQMSRPDLVRSVVHLRKQRDSFDTVKEKLQADLKAAQEQIESLRAQTAELAAAQTTAASLRQNNETLAAEKAALEDRLAERGRELAELRAAKDQESAEARELRDALARKTEEAEHLASQVTGLRADVARLDGELSAARSEIADLQARLKVLGEAKTEAETASAALQASQAEAKAQAAKIEELAKTIEALRASEAEKTAQIARIEEQRHQLDTRLGEANTLAAERAGQLEKAKAEAAEQAEKIHRLERLVEQTEALDIDQLATRARTATDELARTKEQLARAQQSLLARTEAEKRLIEERNRQIEAEREAARARRAREEELHKHLADAADARREKNHDTALWHLRKVLEMEPDHVQAVSHIGMILAERGEDGEAESMLVRASRLDPENTDVLLRLGYVQLRQTKMYEALGTLVQGAKLAPEKAEFRHFAGIACRSLGWPVASEMQLKEAFRLDATNADTAFNLAILLATLDEPRTDEAREWYQKALELGAKPDAGLDRYFREN